MTPFPAVESSAGLKALPARVYVECAGCIELLPLDDIPDPVAWAAEHTRVRPWHTTFRITHITNFSTGVSLPEDEDAP